MPRKLIRPTTGLNAHRLIAETAIALANTVFDEYMKINPLYRAMKTDGLDTERKQRRAFVAKVAPRFLEQAREALTECLSQPDDRVTPAMKQTIYEALLADNDLRANRTVAASSAAVPEWMN